MKQRKISEEDKLKNALDEEVIIRGEEIDGIGDMSTKSRIPVIDPAYLAIRGCQAEATWKGKYYSK
ncbi:hypothetical protein HYW74_01160 [Candidatus Pacearchaeota archaeon]|nr:hypothetical protein [Candidatus Pacearchaeota archaeon]MBI4156876.1 hypothetical protein [Candidatus Woesearchaeota archaeon]